MSGYGIACFVNPRRENGHEQPSLVTEDPIDGLLRDARSRHDAVDAGGGEALAQEHLLSRPHDVGVPARRPRITTWTQVHIVR